MKYIVVLALVIFLIIRCTDHGDRVVEPTAPAQKSILREIAEPTTVKPATTQPTTKPLAAKPATTKKSPANSKAMTAKEFVLTEEMREETATFLNMNGFLCARVEDLAPLKAKGTVEITCTEYRGGKGTVRYILDTGTGAVFKAD